MPSTNTFSLITVTQAITDLSNKIASTAWVKSLGGSTPITHITANYTSTGYEDVRCDSSAGVVTIWLPNTPAAGMKVGVTRTGTNNVIVSNNANSIHGVGLDTITLDRDRTGLWLTWDATNSVWIPELRLAL